MNIFQCSFDQRLRSWRNLRTVVSTKNILDKCIEIDDWWQMAPLVNHHLHILDQTSWPDPWTLLSENTYCLLTRALGIVNTLEMSQVNQVELVIATNQQGDEHPIVLVDNAKYILNYYPKSVVNNCLKDFTIKRKLSLDSLTKKIK